MSLSRRNVGVGGNGYEEEIWENQSVIKRSGEKRIWGPISSGRPAFSDRLGEKSLRNPNEYKSSIPAGYYCPSTSGNFIVDLSDKHSNKCDQDGWSYQASLIALDGDYAKGSSKGYDSKKFMYRRRRWIRTLLPLPSTNSINVNEEDVNNKPLFEGWLGIKSMSKTRRGTSIGWKSRYCVIWAPSNLQLLQQQQQQQQQKLEEEDAMNQQEGVFSDDPDRPHGSSEHPPELTTRSTSDMSFVSVHSSDNNNSSTFQEQPIFETGSGGGSASTLNNNNSSNNNKSSNQQQQQHNSSIIGRSSKLGKLSLKETYKKHKGRLQHRGKGVSKSQCSPETDPTWMYYKMDTPHDSISRSSLDDAVTDSTTMNNKSVKNAKVRWFVLGPDCEIDDTIATPQDPGYFAIHFSKKHVQILNAFTEQDRLHWVSELRACLAYSNGGEKQYATHPPIARKKYKQQRSPSRSFSTSQLPVAPLGQGNSWSSTSSGSLMPPHDWTDEIPSIGSPNTPGSGGYTSVSTCSPVNNSKEKEFPTRHNSSSQSFGGGGGGGNGGGATSRHLPTSSGTSPRMFFSSSAGGGGYHRNSRSQSTNEFVEDMIDNQTKSTHRMRQFGRRVKQTLTLSKKSGEPMEEEEEKDDNFMKKLGNGRRLSIIVPPVIEPSQLHYVKVCKNIVACENGNAGGFFVKQKQNGKVVVVRIYDEDLSHSLQVGDQLLKIGEKTIDTINDATEAAEGLMNGQFVVICISRSVNNSNSSVLSSDFTTDTEEVNIPLSLGVLSEEEKLEDIHKMFDLEVPQIISNSPTNCVITYKTIQKQLCLLLGIPMSTIETVVWRKWFRDQLDLFFERNQERYFVGGLDIESLSPIVEKKIIE